MKQLFTKLNLHRFALAVLLLAGLSSSFITQAQVGPAGVNNGILTWLDASDPDADGNPANNPADSTSLPTWEDKSGKNNDAKVLTTAGYPGVYRSNSTSTINTHSVVQFRSNHVYRFDSIDIRAISIPDITVIVVYKQGNATRTGLWGNDNMFWDRFMYTSWVGTNGIASQGAVPPNYTNIPGSGISGQVYLFTSVYDGQITSTGANVGPTDSSAFYFNGALLGRFTDRTDASNSQPNLRLGWDGDGEPAGGGTNPGYGKFNGDIAEFAVYNRKLTVCEMQQINRYLSIKYGITFSTATITASDTSAISCNPVTLTATAGGLTYQWLLNGNAISGATNQTYVARQSGSYTVAITTNCGTDTSAATVITIPTPTLTCPQNITVNNDPGRCGAVVTYPAPTATSACGSCSRGDSIPGYTYIGNYNGHDYYKSTAAGSWTAQNAAAQAVGAHLVTIRDSSENNFVAAAASGSTPWIGLMEQTTEGNYVWVNGEPVTYTNWSPGEPNNLGGVENRTVINWLNNPGKWNDLNDAAQTNAVIEFDCSIRPVRTSGPVSGSFFPIGTTTVTYATDTSSNASTCSFTVTVNGNIPTCSITSTPTDTTYTGGVPNRIYLGYGAQSTTLKVTPSGGSGFTYSWSPAAGLSATNIANPVFTPTAAGNYTFTATVTNSNGCTTTCSITICVWDIRVAGNGNSNNKKVYICHIPPGNPSNAHTISVSVNAVAAHLAHGDNLGACDQSCSNSGARMVSSGATELADEVKLYTNTKVYPNPNKGVFTLELPYFENTASIRVTDILGRAILTREVRGDMSGNKLSLNLGNKAKGQYFVEVQFGQDQQSFRTKIIVQ